MTSWNNREAHARLHVTEGLLKVRTRRFGGMAYVKTEAGLEALRRNAPKLSKDQNRDPDNSPFHRRSPIARDENDLACDVPRRLKFFCRACRRVGAGLPCCKKETNRLRLPFTAKPPRVTASAARWEQFYRVYPQCRMKAAE
jgi:hypothetical protein